LAQREMRVELYTRQPDESFRSEVLGPGAHARLTRANASLSVDELYAGVLALPGD
jgi:hypothetical protein